MVAIRKKILKNVKRVVIKVGASVLTDKTGSLDYARISGIAGQVCRLKAGGIEVIIVSSGAIAGGMCVMGLAGRPSDISKKQALAAIGQIQIMKAYERFFKAKGVNTAQVLLTQDDFTDRKRYLNAKNTLSALLGWGAVPVINENDTTATEEIKFGDNDKLSGLVAELAEAQLLLILSDVDGLWDDSRRVINVVEKVTAAVENLAKGTTRETSTGGMVTKLAAAKAVTKKGMPCVIANGHTDGILSKILDGEDIGTLFLPVTTM